MNDLRHELDRLAGPAHVPTQTEIEADLHRGRRALRRRRTVQAMAGSTFAVAAVVAAVAVATSGTVTPADTTNPPSAVIAAELVAYTGKQPNGFTIDKVPAGFYIQGDDDYTLVIAPENQQQPTDQPSVDIGSPDVFIGKIVVMLQSADQEGAPEGQAVQVGDRKGVLATSPEGDSGRTLWVEQPNGIWLLLQFWEDLGLSETAMVEMGAGVHVHADAKQGRG